MKVILGNGAKPQVFAPIELTITLESLEEALALRALGRGISMGDAIHIHSNAMYKDKIEPNDILRVIVDITKVLHANLADRGDLE